MSNSVEEDREMVCRSCGTRVFTSRAPDLVGAHFRCPRCRGEMALVGPPLHLYGYPTVTPHARRQLG